MSTVTVFVSSKMRELKSERALLHQLIPNLDLGAYRLQPWVFEAADGAASSSSSIRDVYLNALQRSALYIGIIGAEYGEWTIDEFNHATRWGIDRQLYVKGDPQQDRGPQLKVFLDRWNDVETGITVKFFATLEELTQAVSHALEQWTAEQVQARPPSTSAQVLTTPDQVPERTAQLFGRSQLVERICHDVETGAPTLISGFAGIGKTVIAAAVCETWLKQHSLALWLRCGFSRAEDIVAAIARSFGREIAPHTLGRDEYLQLLAARLKEVPQALLVLDDCWNGEALFSIVSAVPRGTPILVTARQQYPFEHIHEIEELPSGAALELLSSSAGRDLAKDEAAAQLCEALSNHAFSIQIAGRVLKVQRRTPSELLRQVAASPHELTAPLGFGERSRRNVKSLLNLSLDALNADQQLAFLAFGAFFAPTLTSEMVHQFLNDMVFWGDDKLTLPVVGHGARSFDSTASFLRELEEHNLVRRISAAQSPLTYISMSATSERRVLDTRESKPPDVEVYRVHDLAYSFARSKASDTQRRHALDISLASAFFYNEPAQSVFDILRPQLNNFIGAAAWAMTSGYPLYAERVSDLLACSGRFLQNQGLYEHALTLLGYAKRSARLRADERAVIRNVVEIANIMMQSGRIDEARDAYEGELERARMTDRPSIEGVLLADLAALHLQLRDFEGAERVSREALAVARQSKQEGLEADVLGNLGLIVAEMGRADEAVELIEDAARRHAETNNDRGVAIDLSHLGDLHRRAGDWGAAATDYERALAIFERFAVLRGVAATAYGLAVCRLNLGQTEAGSPMLEKARSSYASLGDDEMIAVCDALKVRTAPRGAAAEYDLAGDLMVQGRHADAEAAYRRAAALGHGNAANNLGALLLKQDRLEDARVAFDAGIQHGCGTAAVNLGGMFEREGRFDDAERAYKRGVEIGAGLAASSLGAMYFRRGRSEEAEPAFRKGIELGDGSASYNLGVLMAKAGRRDEARALYQQGLDRGHADAAANLGALIYSEGKQDEAKKVWSEGADLGSGLAATNLAACLLEQGRVAEAETMLRRGIELQNAVAARYLGMILEDQGRLDEAQTAYQLGAERGDDESANRLSAMRQRSSGLARGATD